MKRDRMKVICCITALAALLAAAAGCSSKNGSDNTPAADTSKPYEASDTDDAEVSEKPEEPADTKESSDSDPDETLGNADLPDEGDAGDISFRLVSGTVSDLPDRGYAIFDTNDSEDEYPFKLLIGSGEKSTGGYDIKIVNIEYDGTTLTVTVKETAPGPDDFVTEALTYPCCAAEFNQIPDSIEVVDIGGTSFDCIYGYLANTDIPDGWFAVLEDGAGEIMRKTFVYEREDGTYKYINATSTTESYGSAQWKTVINSFGIAETRDDVVKAASEAGSAGFVLRPDDSTVYTIEEFTSAKAF